MNDFITVKELRAEYRQQKQLEQERVKGQFPSWVLYVVAVLVCLLAYQII